MIWQVLKQMSAGCVLAVCAMRARMLGAVGSLHDPDAQLPEWHLPPDP